MDWSVGFAVDWWVVLGVVVYPIVTALIPIVSGTVVEILGNGATISRGSWTWFFAGQW